MQPNATGGRRSHRGFPDSSLFNDRPRFFVYWKGDMERHEFSIENLTRLYRSTPAMPLRDDRPIVIFSDLHLGNGTRTDDFRNNSELFSRVLKQYYYDNDFTLVLNGDIEELQRFRLADILRRWADVYELFGAFEEDDRLFRLVGNHDMDLMSRADHPFAIREALRFSYHDNPIFIFHGHQTSTRFERFNKLVGFGLRYFANPLKIKNYSVAHDSVKRFRTEERVYEFASAKKVLSIIGHTHRPLFESMSKVDSIKFEIERLCRKYPKASRKKQLKIERSIGTYRSELEQINSDDDPTASVASLYNANLVVPCMFNSGTVIGKRGMTCLEIADGRIALVHWFDDTRSDKYLRYANYDTEPLRGTDYHRVEIKRDTLDYVFARIKLLAGTEPVAIGSA
jgi:UDP-2,3-diacylglucosamine pyrophosphatase LpxH